MLLEKVESIGSDKKAGTYLATVNLEILHSRVSCVQNMIGVKIARGLPLGGRMNKPNCSLGYGFRFEAAGVDFNERAANNLAMVHADPPGVACALFGIDTKERLDFPPM